MRPTCHSSKEGWLHKGVSVDLAEEVMCPVGTEKKAGILPQLHSQWERWHFWNLFLVIGN